MESSKKLYILPRLFLSKCLQLSLPKRFVKYYENDGITIQEQSLLVIIIALSIYYGSRLVLWAMFFLFGCIAMYLLTDKFNYHLPLFF